MNENYYITVNMVEELPEGILDDMDACCCACGIFSGGGSGTTVIAPK